MMDELPSIAAPVLGLTRKFSPLEVTMRRRSTVGLKSIPKSEPVIARGLPILSTNCPNVPIATANPVWILMA
ncbi:MAG: hypothetical protein V7K36_00355 [Nostoc sp.]